MRIILEVPNQQFSFCAYAGNETFRFGGMIFGTILLVTDIVEDDSDALMCFGLPDGEKQANIAFWAPFAEFNRLWSEVLKEKRKCLTTIEREDKS